MFESPASADKFMRALQDRDIGCMYGKETSHLRQKVLEDPHSSNLYVAEIPLTVTEEVSRVGVWRGTDWYSKGKLKLTF